MMLSQRRRCDVTMAIVRQIDVLPPHQRGLIKVRYTDVFNIADGVNVKASSKQH